MSLPSLTGIVAAVCVRSVNVMVVCVANVKVLYASMSGGYFRLETLHMTIIPRCCQRLDSTVLARGFQVHKSKVAKTVKGASWTMSFCPAMCVHYRIIPIFNTVYGTIIDVILYICRINVIKTYAKNIVTRLGRRISCFSEGSRAVAHEALV